MRAELCAKLSSEFSKYCNSSNPRHSHHGPHLLALPCSFMTVTRSGVFKIYISSKFHCLHFFSEDEMEAENLSQLPKVTWHDWFLQGFGFSLCPQRHRVPGNWLSVYSDQGMTLVLCRGKRHKWFPMSRFGILWVGLPPHSLCRASPGWPGGWGTGEQKGLVSLCGDSQPLSGADPHSLWMPRTPPQAVFNHFNIPESRRETPMWGSVRS